MGFCIRFSSLKRLLVFKHCKLSFSLRYSQNSLIRKSPILCGSVLLSVMLPSALTISLVGVCDKHRILALCSLLLKIRKPIKSWYAATYVVHELEKDLSFRHSASRFLVLKWSAYPSVPDTQNSKQRITRIIKNSSPHRMNYNLEVSQLDHFPRRLVPMQNLLWTV